LKDGTAILETDIGVVEDDPEGVKEFMDMLYRRSDVPAIHSAACLADWLEPGAKVLDLGGGHGRYAKAFVDVGFTATLFDKGICVDIARERHGDEFAVIAGDFHTDDLGGPYDAIFLSNIVHGLDEVANQALIERLADALAPGGRLVVKDFFAEGSGLQPEGAVVFGMVMLMFTQGGRTYTVGEMQDMLALAGLSPAEVVQVTDQGYDLVVGRRLV
jgi:SAM-dependent methyltransferase